MAGLLDVARKLAEANPKRPAQPYLRRAISTAYYAVFETLATECANAFIGNGPGHSQKARLQVFRALEHGFAKNACKQAAKLNFPQDIIAFADVFIKLQEERHKADYDPFTSYSRAYALVKIQEAEIAILSLRKAPRADTESG